MTATPRRPPVFGPEPWTAAAGADWCHFDRWFAIVAACDFEGDLDALDAELVRRLRSLHGRGDVEAKLSHLTDLKARLTTSGIDASALVASDEPDKATVVRARRKVLDQELEDRAMTPAMRDTPSARDGFKGHIAVEPDTGMVTDCELTPGPPPTATPHPVWSSTSPPAPRRWATPPTARASCGDHLERTKMTATIKPPPLRPAVPGGFSLDDFEIDEQARTVTCPAGIVVALSATRRASFGANCRTCSLAAQCTTATAGRVIVLHPPSPPPRRRPGSGPHRRLRRGLPAVAADGRAQPGLADP